MEKGDTGDPGSAGGGGIRPPTAASDHVTTRKSSGRCEFPHRYQISHDGCADHAWVAAGLRGGRRNTPPFSSLLPQHRFSRDDGRVVKRASLIFCGTLAFAACALAVANAWSTAIGVGRVAKNLQVTVVNGTTAAPISDIEVSFRSDRDQVATQVTDERGQAVLHVDFPSNIVSDLFRRDGRYGIVGQLELRSASGPLMTAPLWQLLPGSQPSLETPLAPLTLVVGGR